MAIVTIGSEHLNRIYDFLKKKYFEVPGQGEKGIVSSFLFLEIKISNLFISIYHNHV